MPTFAMRALRVKDDKGASVEKRKRSPSPKLIPESGKKSRLHEKKEEAQMAVTGTSNDSETETTQAETGGRAGSTSSTRNEDKSVEGKASVADTAKVGYAGAGACESVTVVRLGPAPRTWEVQAPILAKTAGTPPVGRSLSPNKPSLERSSGLNSGVSSAQDATRIQEADIVRPTAEDAVAVRRRQEAVVKEERRRAIEAERKIGRRAGARARAGAEAELRLEEQGGGQQRTEEDSAGLKRAFDVSVRPSPLLLLVRC